MKKKNYKSRSCCHHDPTLWRDQTSPSSPPLGAASCQTETIRSQTLFVFAGVSFSVVLMVFFCCGFWLPVRIPPPAPHPPNRCWSCTENGAAPVRLKALWRWEPSSIKAIFFLKNKQTKSHKSSLQPQQIFRLIICWNCGFALAVEHLMRLRKSAEKAENRCVGFKPPLMAFQCTLWQIGDAVYPILYSALISFMTAHRAAAVQKRFSCTDVYFCPSICAHPSGALPPLKFIMW